MPHPIETKATATPLAQGEAILGRIVATIPTPGYQTSEFWAVMIGCAAIVLNKKLDLGLTGEQIAGLGAAIAGYALSRGIAKKN